MCSCSRSPQTGSTGTAGVPGAGADGEGEHLSPHTGAG